MGRTKLFFYLKFEEKKTKQKKKAQDFPADIPKPRTIKDLVKQAGVSHL